MQIMCYVAKRPNLMLKTGPLTIYSVGTN